MGTVPSAQPWLSGAQAFQACDADGLFEQDAATRHTPRRAFSSRVPEPRHLFPRAASAPVMASLSAIAASASGMELLRVGLLALLGVLRSQMGPPPVSRAGRDVRIAALPPLFPESNPAPRALASRAHNRHTAATNPLATEEYVHSGSDEGDLSDCPAVSLVVENYRPVQVLPAAD